VAEFLIAVHGGAGQQSADHDVRWPSRAAALAEGLRAGLVVLRSGGAAVEAVVAAILVLEDHENFNAGRGSALTSAGTVEMDAAVADGAGCRSGAVAVISGVRHPIAAARAVMDDGHQALLAGSAAADFARAAGLAFEAPGWFVTEAASKAQDGPGGSTVGAVALDRDGHLAAATSTGGRAGQAPGRIGDSPIIGAGTWADDRTCAVSATGHGEAFIRAAFAHEVDAQIRLGGCDLDEACRRALAQVEACGGTGGCVALDPHGHLSMPFTTAVMHRGWAGSSGPVLVGTRPGPLEAFGPRR
jgi:isoaspartyl peptidase/L-asparaginase-like protein (Ntn-hydrolase superfamily)